MGNQRGCGGGGGGNAPPPEEYDTMAVEYRYMQDAFSGKTYGCLDWGTDALTDAFKEGDVLPIITYGDTITADSYPPSWAELSGDIMIRYSQADSTPWYLESGNAPVTEAQWAEGAYGIASPTTPYWSFALVFVGKIKNDVSNNPWTCINMVTIHEMGHQYAHLSDKYLHPQDHSYDTCCVMDSLTIFIDSVKKCEHFCPKCVDSIRKVDWYY